MRSLRSFRLTGQDHSRVAEEPRLPTRYNSEQNALTDGVWVVGTDEQSLHGFYTLQRLVEPRQITPPSNEICIKVLTVAGASDIGD